MLQQTSKDELQSVTRSVSPPAKRRKLRVPASDHAEVDASTKPASVIKVVSWNVNGVGPFLQLRLDAVSISPLRDKLRRHDWPQMCCLQEVKISPGDSHTQRRLQNAVNEGLLSGEPAYEILYSLPRDPHNAKGFGGKVHGVASIIRKDFASRIIRTRKPDWDLEGRILIHETNLDLIIINGYWVNGTSAPWRDGNGRADGNRHDLKLRYHDRILNEALRYQQQGCHVLLVGDMNVALDNRDGHPKLRTAPIQHVHNRTDFNRKFFLDRQGLKAVDVFRHVHGDARKYTYHSSHTEWGMSCDRVDHIIASRSIVNSSAIVDSDICDTREDAAHSDHVPLWVSIDANKLEKTSEPASMIPQATCKRGGGGTDSQKVPNPRRNHSYEG